MTKEKIDITKETFHEVATKMANELNAHIKSYKDESFYPESASKTVISEKIIEGMEFVIKFTLQPIGTEEEKGDEKTT